MKKFLVILGILLLVGVGMRATLHLYLNKKLQVNGKVLVEVKKGASFKSVVARLSRQKLILYPRLFVELGRFYGYDKKLKFGEYLLTSQDTYRGVMDKLASGKTYRYQVTLVEGDHMYDYARQLEKKKLCKKADFLKLTKDPAFVMSLVGERLSSLEGYLFPETYHFSKNDSCRTIVMTMVKKFLSEIGKISYKKTGLNRHQLVTLASIIEKETGAAFERPMISSVFFNRMKKKMRLQTDPTIIYGILDKEGREIKNIRKKHIKAPTAYNTYVIKGLPPGPIGNPGLASLRAAANPDKTPYLYFVSQNDGTHVFTKNYKDHLKAVRKFQLNSKARKGKSWRDLKKKGR